MDTLNGVAPTSQPSEALAEPDSLPSLADSSWNAEQLNGTPVGPETWDEEMKAWKTSWESGSTMSVCSAPDTSQETRKSFYSTGVPEEDSEAVSPPNRLLHNMHGANLQQFLEDSSASNSRQVLFGMFFSHRRASGSAAWSLECPRTWPGSLTSSRPRSKACGGAGDPGSCTEVTITSSLRSRGSESNSGPARVPKVLQAFPTGS